MSIVELPYGRGTLRAEIPEERMLGVVHSQLHGYTAPKPEQELVLEAMRAPTGTPTLAELAQGKKNITVIASDHTRPVPSRLIMPPMLEEIRRGNPDAQITILIATGCHREMTRDELVQKFGEEIVEREHIVIHDCDDEENLVLLGTLPSGGACKVNRLATEADLLVAEGFIEPHFFAGFSGGRKSVLPGVASRETVLANHCAEFIAHPRTRTGMLEGNPIHEDMVWAMRAAKLAYIVNVVLNPDKKVIYAVAGDAEKAHLKGCEFLAGLCQVTPPAADIVISTNGGYPLDQDAYQAVKGMTAAEACVKEGGVIIMLSRCESGLGGEAFFRQLAEEPDGAKTMAQFMSRDRGETEPDQWQTQIFLRVLERAQVILVSGLEDELVRKMHMTPAHCVEEALTLADEMLGRTDGTVNVIADGVSVIVK